MDRPIPYDLARCRGKDCGERLVCKRHLTIPLDEKFKVMLAPYYETLRDPQSVKCGMYLEVE
jgi:hypothetical protein